MVYVKRSKQTAKEQQNSMDTGLLFESAHPVVRRGNRGGSPVPSWAIALCSVLLVAVVCLMLARDPRNFTTLETGHAVVRESLLQILSASPDTSQDSTFGQFKGLSHEERAQIYQGYMVCCKRDDKDIGPPAYKPHYYEDWPIDPLCIPGYVQVGCTFVCCKTGKVLILDGASGGTKLH